MAGIPGSRATWAGPGTQQTRYTLGRARNQRVRPMRGSKSSRFCVQVHPENFRGGGGCIFGVVRVTSWVD